MAPHSSTLAWRIPWTEEPGGLLSMGSHRVRHDWSDLAAAALSQDTMGPSGLFRIIVAESSQSRRWDRASLCSNQALSIKFHDFSLNSAWPIRPLWQASLMRQESGTSLRMCFRKTAWAQASKDCSLQPHSLQTSFRGEPQMTFLVLARSGKNYLLLVYSMEKEMQFANSHQLSGVSGSKSISISWKKPSQLTILLSSELFLLLKWDQFIASQTHITSSASHC